MDEQVVDQAIEGAIKQLKSGGLILVSDDRNREAEGDFLGIAEYATPESVNTMVTYGRGLVCAPMTAERAKALNMHLMTDHNTETYATAFTVSTDHVTTTTGISAYDRATTIKALSDTNAKPDDFEHPGHMFPLIAVDGGVLVRDGHTEAAVDLATMAGAAPVAYICETLKPDGHMNRFAELEELAAKLEIPLITVEELINYRYRHNIDAVRAENTVKLPTEYGEFELTDYTSTADNRLQLALAHGDVANADVPLVRLHSECLTGDVFGSHRCDCGEQLHQALSEVAQAPAGLLVYLRQEGRGIGLKAKIAAYHLQEGGLDTVEANEKLGFAPDQRDYGIAAAILHAQGIHQIRLLTNNPDKVARLEYFGIKVVERVPLEVAPRQENRDYLATKQEKFHHELHVI
ncbi:bifunctional 3,4-dihydroxy-2-butanone-4-phosphate synthase/GTP cyclohydrolase II [Loigolactobacillus bifermentans]|uniref:GTP cyclohydrolase-2 n=1 Tax=Loigolactobacillus bifermentans DSM 20003 TaxID=1423726 RepID=A0A0R1H0G5_9LACO|nr:bifunctional 3,4-dihydroxy-2-butanone-4-phosphate synthase/GTP cyclohydrolase II [Loigolactobacillus bifermentans]KRK37188.1 GTP cyclohydrolase II [Loigolactobacillus bifermentans DSM 20003]QGG60626.1 bifunctional 3,4-dihydroxy-2-butanone-4-phosphate synthase/GTP cyclohydrolase II [Loigolactobacillus bifermentans]